MNSANFSEDDKEKFIEFLNCVAKSAEFKFKTEDVIKYFKLLSHMQQTILPKINANILEVKRVIDPPQPAVEKAQPKKGRK
jgi:hypothetical protein